jgi:hypothetical protein
MERRGVTLNRSSNDGGVPIVTLVPNLLYKGCITILAGEPGIGKTTFALELVDALEQGGLLWGTVEVPQTRILWLDFDHRITRLREIMEAYYGERHRRNILCLRPEQLCPLSPETLPAYIELIRREGIDLIVADFSLDWLDVWGVSPTIARRKIALLRKLVNSTGVGVLLIHLMNKRGKVGTTTSLLGGKVWLEQADVVAFLAYDEVSDWEIVRLTIAKDLYASETSMLFRCHQRRFIPVFPAPSSVWEIVYEYLCKHRWATYEELLEVLTEKGYPMTYKALAARVKRWRRRGKVNTERTGFPARASIFLREA